MLTFVIFQRKLYIRVDRVLSSTILEFAINVTFMCSTIYFEGDHVLYNLASSRICQATFLHIWGSNVVILFQTIQSSTNLKSNYYTYYDYTQG